MPPKRKTNAALSAADLHAARRMMSSYCGAGALDGARTEDVGTTTLYLNLYFGGYTGQDRERTTYRDTEVHLPPKEPLVSYWEDDTAVCKALWTAIRAAELSPLRTGPSVFSKRQLDNSQLEVHVPRAQSGVRAHLMQARKNFVTVALKPPRDSHRGSGFDYEAETVPHESVDIEAMRAEGRDNGEDADIVNADIEEQLQEHRAQREEHWQQEKQARKRARARKLNGDTHNEAAPKGGSHYTFNDVNKLERAARKFLSDMEHYKDVTYVTDADSGRGYFVGSDRRGERVEFKPYKIENNTHGDCPHLLGLDGGMLCDLWAACGYPPGSKALRRTLPDE